jgi:hypothetical protein
MRYLRLVALAWLTLFGTHGALAAVPNFRAVDGPEAVQMVANWTNLRLVTGEIGAIDEALAQYRADDERFADGMPRALGVSRGLTSYCARAPLGEGAMKSVREWRKAAPRSAAGLLTEACLWRESAWNARGPGYASEVSEEGWRLFHERLQKARELLIEGKDFASSTPLWYVAYMEVQLGINASLEDIDATFREGQKRFPTYEPLYFQFLRTHLPQWRGDAANLEPVLRNAVKVLPADDADAMYARGWWYVEQSVARGAIFTLGADWARIQRGMQRLEVKFPDSDFNRSKLGAFACRAKDADVYGKVRRSLGERIRRDAFEPSLGMDECDQTLAPEETIEAFSKADFALDMAIRKACGKSGSSSIADPGEVVRLFPRLLEARRAFRDRYRRDDPEMAARITDTLGFFTRVNASDAREVCGVVGFTD